jgi:tetratricopeptide (TPR) repeat protein
MDWYRRTTWTKTDETEYFAKLKRARAASRPQYLILQAAHLVGTKEPALLDVAESLIQKFHATYPDDKFHRSASLELLGDIYRERKSFEIALTYYKKSIDFEQEYPNVQENAFLSLSELVVKQNMQQYFTLAESLLLAKLEHYPFPIYKYKMNALLSIIYKSKGENELARQFAEKADQYATLQTSGFRYHPAAGVVTERDAALDNLMNATTENDTLL